MEINNITHLFFSYIFSNQLLYIYLFKSCLDDIDGPTIYFVDTGRGGLKA